MSFKAAKFSLLEVIIVMIILVLVVTVAISGFGSKSTGETVLELKDVLGQVFKNASIRAQTFAMQVDVKVSIDSPDSATFNLTMVPINPELPVVNPEEMDESEIESQRSHAADIKIWSGDDDYSLPEGIKLVDYENIVNENKEVYFRFFPDGEAIGPDLNFMVGEREFRLTVDRLNGQLIVAEKNND